MSLEDAKFDETADLLIETERALGVDLSGVETAEEYAGFRASAAYRRWQASRRE